VNYFDIIILLPIAYGLVRGIINGLVGEITSIVAVSCGVIAAKIWAAPLAVEFEEVFMWTKSACEMIAYLLLFIGVVLSLTLIGKLFSKILSKLRLGGMNKILGGIFGAAKLTIIVSVVIMGVDLLDTRFHFIKEETKSASIAYKPLCDFASTTWDSVSEQSTPPETL